MGGFGKSPKQTNRSASPAASVPNKINIPKGASADVREIDNGKVVRVTDGNYQTVKEVFVPDGEDVTIG